MIVEGGRWRRGRRRYAEHVGATFNLRLHMCFQKAKLPKVLFGLLKRVKMKSNEADVLVK